MVSGGMLLGLLLLLVASLTQGSRDGDAVTRQQGWAGQQGTLLVVEQQQGRARSIWSAGCC
jgi:hypothetical protein